ncbi:hypothetical protein GOEFS_105_00930 [Gordonia effusa NBRC 100432]|uniref:DUF4145 domain-containing protein n=1 Tax=Gordonia effusa NBRC 100432 TaxID=1077974 RepID=H0R4T1_9ACTN|nr:DUF4145 domain-containing protein [Gordonia effusa]GAB20082.1 hypothetical protein GOEFS_105_00930 [Gordonia effusa NBRC 100432]
MHNTVCWHCNAVSHHVLKAAVAVTSARDPAIETRWTHVYGAFQCSSCLIYSVGIAALHESDVWGSASEMLARSEIQVWRPSPGMTRSYEDVPTHIADAATEAYECHAQSHYRASILLARSVIEASAKEVGITKGRLIDKIEKLYDDQWIREHVKDGADSIRDFGNDMAHGDFVQPVTEEESALVIALMEEILVEVFQSRAKVAKAQAAVAARKQHGQVTP